MKQEKLLNHFIINNLLIFFGLITVISGLTLQVGYHMGSHNRNFDAMHNADSQPVHYEQAREIDTSKITLGLDYFQCSNTHKVAITFFSLLMLYHTFTHWKWYKVVIRKNLLGKNKQVIILSFLFILVALTGLLPWFIYLSGSTDTSRLVFIEIHDKLALILVIYLVLHVIKRRKWYSLAYSKLKT